ncbi:hypothetical protein H6F43_07365 [Leptolyngbya sp. FACHB-36]|uniref:YncE family protein n=1 Tax=Leptolyngbya sp. FACHB-36 TaxID=2692808 RepID=UPI001680C65E|nr:hypothetical protein [Leptolyngbya sp. FACHB-36]MBD2020004.1 hypothetical protein [Leptolyngbya sp. FACHB-36]
MDTRVTSRHKFAASPRGWLIAWAVLRLPLLVIALYMLREELLELVEQVIGVSSVTERAIALISTFWERALVFGVCVMILMASISLTRRLRSRTVQYLVPATIALVLFFIVFALFARRGALLAIALTGLLALNTIPDGWVTRAVTTKVGSLLANLGFGGAVGLAELLLPKPFLLWLLTRLHGRDVVVTGAGRYALDGLPVIMVSAIAALVLNTAPLVDLGQMLHRDAAVQRFAKGDFNVLAFNRDQRVLYASGRGVEYLQAYSVDRLDQPPRQSSVTTYYAQGFSYNPEENELYFYGGTEDAQVIEVLDATSLNRKKSLPLPIISPGDSWLVWDRFTDDIIIASEADRQEGTPFVAVNRRTGAITKTLDVGPSYIFISRDKPLLYMNFFRRTTDLIQYNTQTHQVLKRVPTDKQVDRMALVASTNELLVSSPVKSSVVRYDANTLERKGDIKTTFGVRTVAVDATRNLLLTGSLATNMLEVIDLKTYKRLAQYRLGPWLREICLDPESGVAYVSSNGALYKVNYTDRL